jgi:hypothetical protein
MVVFDRKVHPLHASGLHCVAQPGYAQVLKLLLLH